MPIYEFACPRCRVIFSFLAKRLNPEGTPKCPKCGNKKLVKELSRFALGKSQKAATKAGTEGSPESSHAPGGPDADSMPDMDDPRVESAMSQLERDMEHMDENNPRHMGHLMRRMKELMPPGSMPKELDVAIKRLEAGEDPEKIEADMGDVLGDLMGDEQGGGGGGGYSRDAGLYDY